MKLTEKAEKARTTFKSRCKQSVRPRFSGCGRSAGKAGKCRKKPTPFSGFFRHIPKPLAEKVCAKFVYLAWVISIRRPFSDFSENQFWVHRSARPVATGKLPVTMRPEKSGQRPKTPDGLRAVGIFSARKFLEKNRGRFILIGALRAAKRHREERAAEFM